MIQTSLFNVGARFIAPDTEAMPEPCTSCDMPRRITWREDGKVFRGRPWHFGLGIWRAIITHAVDPWHVGKNRLVEHRQVVSVRPQ